MSGLIPTISDELLRHHLGCPADADLDEVVETRIALARDWYSKHGRPWTRTARVSMESSKEGIVTLDGGGQLESRRLAAGLRSVDSQEIVIVAVSAGEEIDAEIARLWDAERPDESMFLNAYGSAIAEELRAAEQRRLSSEVRGEGLHVLPGYSPGYEGWSLGDQRPLFDRVADAHEDLRDLLEVLPSGGLRP